VCLGEESGLGLGGVILRCWPVGGLSVKLLSAIVKPMSVLIMITKAKQGGDGLGCLNYIIPIVISILSVIPTQR
jgi:hypothetical protein